MECGGLPPLLQSELRHDRAAEASLAQEKAGASSRTPKSDYSSTPIAFLLALVCLFSVSCNAKKPAQPVPGSPHQQALDKLFDAVKFPETSNDATDKFEALAQSDPTIRPYLVDRVPALIEAGPADYRPPVPEAAVQYPGPVWLNGVKLARDFEIVEAIPALAKWIPVSRSHMSTLAWEQELTFNPAGQVLIEMGDPAVPALQNLLENGNVHQRYDCYRALAMIQTPKALRALSDDLPREQDQELVREIKRTLEVKQAKDSTQH
jgi:hypothetical protein